MVYLFSSIVVPYYFLIFLCKIHTKGQNTLYSLVLLTFFDNFHTLGEQIHDFALSPYQCMLGQRTLVSLKRRNGVLKVHNTTAATLPAHVLTTRRARF